MIHAIVTRLQREMTNALVRRLQCVMIHSTRQAQVKQEDV